MIATAVVFVLGITMAVFAYFDIPSASSAAVNVSVQGVNTQVPLMYIPSSNQYVGGAFRMSADGSTSVTRVVVSETGTVSSGSLSAVRLYYDLDTTAPYDCASESYAATDLPYGFATTFGFTSKATFTGEVAVSPTQSVCFYVVLDVGSGAINGDTLEVAISTPATDVIVSGDAQVCSTPQQSCQPAIVGTTTLSLPPPSVVSVAAIGTQSSFLAIPSKDQYVGGAFRMVPDTGSPSITRVTIKKGGSVSRNNVTSVRLHYDFDTTDPYNCASESYSATDPTYGITTTFDFSSNAAFFGSVEVTPTKAVCFYTVLDIGSSAINGDTLDIEVPSPASNISVSGNATVSPTTSVLLNGVTTLKPLPVSVVTVSSLGTQASFLSIPSKDQYVGGAFRMVLDDGSTSITQVALTEKGTVSGSGISSIRLHYDLDTTAPYDCASESYAATDSKYGSLVNLGFGSSAAFTGSVGIHSAQAICFYVVLDIEAPANNGDTLEVEIANPSLDVKTGEGVNTSPSSAVSLSGATTLTKPVFPVVAVDAIGTQVSLINVPSVSQYMGGAFRMVVGTGLTSITRITINAKGTVARTDISNVWLYYDLDTTAPYDCKSESFSPTDLSYGLPADFGYGGAVIFTGDLGVNPTQTICFYVVVDVESGAKNGDSLEIEISNPEANITASGGATVSPRTKAEIIGTTILSNSSTVSSLPPVNLQDGDLARVKGDVDVYIIKLVGDKKFRRLILNPEVFNSYGHLSWDKIKVVSDLSAYTISTLVRELNDPMVYQMFPTGDTGAKRHINVGAAQFESAGYDWDSIYIINVFERGLYTTGSPIVF